MRRDTPLPQPGQKKAHLHYHMTLFCVIMQEKYFDRYETLFPPPPSTIIISRDVTDSAQVADIKKSDNDSAARFPFSFKLPEDIPCSYEGQYGWVILIFFLSNCVNVS